MEFSSHSVGGAGGKSAELLDTAETWLRAQSITGGEKQQLLKK